MVNSGSLSVFFRFVLLLSILIWQEKMKIAKEFESQLRKVKAVIEKDKTTLQRQHSKTLKKAEKNGYDK